MFVLLNVCILILSLSIGICRDPDLARQVSFLPGLTNNSGRYQKQQHPFSAYIHKQ
jgi:hypothetical protein